MEWLDSDPGAENSMKALSEATNAQRFEAAVKPVGYDEVTPEEKERIKDIHDFRSKVNGERYALGGKAVPTVSLYGGERMHTFDADWLTEPEYNPANTINHLAETAAKMGCDAAHISRVIVDPEVGVEETMPGLHIFFRERVSDEQAADL